MGGGYFFLWSFFSWEVSFGIFFGDDPIEKKKRRNDELIVGGIHVKCWGLVGGGYGRFLHLRERFWSLHRGLIMFHFIMMVGACPVKPHMIVVNPDPDNNLLMCTKKNGGCVSTCQAL